MSSLLSPRAAIMSVILYSFLLLSMSVTLCLFVFLLIKERERERERERQIGRASCRERVFVTGGGR